MYKTVFLFFLASLFANAQSPKITTKDFNLLGKVKRIVETAEKLGEEFSQKQLKETNTIYVPTNYNLMGVLTFNELGNVLDNQDFPNINEKSVYTYDNLNRISTVTDYFSDVKKQKYTPVSKTTFLCKQDTIIATIIRLKDKTEKPLKITRIYKNNQLQSESTEQKSIDYFYEVGVFYVVYNFRIYF